jgi:hypothetical protein
MSYGRLVLGLLVAAGPMTRVLADDKKYETKAPIPCEAVESIGVAQMSPDGVITLSLRSLDPGPRAEGQITYAPDDPQYDEIKQHLGGIAPGEFKNVRPWC